MAPTDIYLTRLRDNGVQTQGYLTIWNGNSLKAFHTLELPWRDNKQDISCIPAGVYDWKKWISPTKGLVIEVLRVPNRDKILIHVANFVRELRGCIAPGIGSKDIDGDGNLDVTSSRKALNQMLEMLPENGRIYINYANQR